MVQTCQCHIVALAGELPLSVDQLLGNDEQRNTFDARHQLAMCIGNLGQHQVNDVLGQLVLTRRDPHLVALEPVTRTQRIGFKVSPIGCGAGHHIAERRARLRLGQTHGARKSSVKFIQGKDLLLQIAAVHHQQIGVAAGEHARADADRSHRKKSIGGRLDRIRQLHAADVVVLRSAEHARLCIGLVGVVRGLWESDFFAVKVGFLRIHEAVKWGVLLARNALAGVEYRVKCLARVVCKALTGLQAVNLQPVVEQKINGGTQTHGYLS